MEGGGPANPGAGEQRGGILAAIDMHLVPRYDKKPGPELVRKVQGRDVILRGMLPCSAWTRGAGSCWRSCPCRPSDTADFVRILLRLARDAGMHAGLVMLDREFFSADVIRVLDDEEVECLIPCRNTMWW